jgi:hypothetical protein
MVVYTCNKCGELNYLTPHAFWNITDFDANCWLLRSVMKNVSFRNITRLNYRIISACSLSTGKTRVLHSERSSDEGGQYANKTNDEYGGI